jgi:hypothetical protein
VIVAVGIVAMGVSHIGMLRFAFTKGEEVLTSFPPDKLADRLGKVSLQDPASLPGHPSNMVFNLMFFLGMALFLIFHTILV